jgi:hypothetical protein
MSQNVVLISGLLIMVIGLALALGARPYFDANKLTQPVVRFSLSSRQVPTLLWTVYQAVLGVVLLLAAGAIVVMSTHWRWPGVLLVAGLLPLGWWQLPGMRLLWTYWLHDGRASLVFCQEPQVVNYSNREFCLNFAPPSVAKLAAHYPRRSRAASADYSYTVLTFADNSELVVTSLLCDYASLCALLPAAKTETVRQRYAWLPTDPYSQHLFGPFFDPLALFPLPAHVRNPASRPAANAARNKRRRPL